MVNMEELQHTRKITSKPWKGGLREVKSAVSADR
jgi:uncharacterized protein (DUF427 family)